MAIDPKQPIPLYFQLKTVLLEEILQGAYGRDGQLPTEHELCDRRDQPDAGEQGSSELAEEGVILRHRRRGTFVNPHWLRRRPDQPELRIVVPEEGPWARMIRDTPSDVELDVVAFPAPPFTRLSRTPWRKDGHRTSPSSTRCGPPSSQPPASSTRSRI